MDELIIIISLLVLVAVGLPVVLIVLVFSTRVKIGELQAQLDKLRARVGELEARPAVAPAESGAPVVSGDEAPAESVTLAADEPASVVDERDTALPQAGVEAEPIGVDRGAAVQPAAAASIAAGPDAVKLDSPARMANPVDQVEILLRRIGDAVKSYFTDGNIFVRVGILILFFGVAFLLKYAAENSRIPIEFRFMGAAAGGLGLLIFGWRLRLRKPVYGLLLQGGGIGVIYITIFTAFKLAHLLPPLLTFALLVFFCAFTVALALLQDSRALAVFALVGGFLAPFLASTGSGNYIGLFSYYTVLNAAVLAVAWFRAWRLLNLLGFAFTFGVFILWVALDYQVEDMLPAGAFLLVFFLMYSLIGVLYALRQPERLTGLVDGTLVFGTPVIVSGLFMAMLRHLDYGIAGASATMGLYYIALARYCWRNIGAEFRLLAEALLAIGVVFATIAIPYALDGHWSSAAWALEAAGILWVSIRQQRFYAQCFAILLQVGAAVLFLLRNFDDIGSSAWINPSFMGGSFIALGALVSSRMLYLQASDFKLRLLHVPFYVWGMGWWLASVITQIDAYVEHQIMALLLLFGATAALLVYLDRLRQWDWMPASINAALLLPVLSVIALGSLVDHGHVLFSPDFYFWVSAIVLNYWIIEKLESVAWPKWVNVAQHTGFVVFLALLLSHELLWRIDRHVSSLGEGFIALLALGLLIAISLAQQGRLPAIKRLGSELQLGIIGTASVLLLLWSLLVNIANSGGASPLPYIPFLNPLDLAHIAFFMLVLGSLRLLPPSLTLQREHILILLAALIFIWLTAVLMRSMHHYLDIRFDLSTLLQDTRVQTAISILWTVIGMGAMLFASRRSLRTLWIAAAGLVGVVLVKMFFVDLGASGTVERIVSFLVVGGLLIATGYFSPIPNKAEPVATEAGGPTHA